MQYDEETQAQSKFDVARVLVRTKYNMVLNQSFNIKVNVVAYSINIVVDVQGMKRLAFHDGKLCGKDYCAVDEDASVDDGSWEGSGDGVPSVSFEPVVAGGGVPKNGFNKGSCHGTDVDK